MTPYGADNPADRCRRFGLITRWSCPCCGQTFWSWQSCTRCDCARCAKKVGARRAARLFERMGGAKLGVWVVTFPADWRDTVGPGRLKAIERAIVERLFRLYATWSKGASVGCRTFWHPTGDKCDTCGKSSHDLALKGECECGASAPWKPHLNVLVPLVAIRDGAVVTLGAWHSERELEEARGAVEVILNDAALAWGLPACRANVFYEYRSGKPLVLHALTYFGRPFPAWDDTLKELHRGKDWGRLSPGARGPVMEAYRAAIRGEPDDEEGGKPCPACGEALTLVAPPVKRESDQGARWVKSSTYYPDLDSESTGDEPPD